MKKWQKSKQNFFYDQRCLKNGIAVSFTVLLMRVHYRAPLNFSTETVEDAKQAFAKVSETVRNVPPNQVPLSDEERRPFEALEASVWEVCQRTILIYQMLWRRCLNYRN